MPEPGLIPSRPPVAPSGPRVLVIAGEASGDMHGARLAKSLLRARPEIRLYGIGGGAMAEAGVSLMFHASELAVVGITEILGRLRHIGKALREVKLQLNREPPDLLVLIDFPDFNLRLARVAARRGIPVVYYISPQIWAWRRARIRQIAQTVSRMIVIFPFEEALYRKSGVPVSYVGHPLLDALEEVSEQTRSEEHDGLGLSPLFPVVGLFPGSRSGEVSRLLPAMLAGAGSLRSRFPRTQFLLGQAPGLPDEVYTPILESGRLPVRRVRSATTRAMALCDLAIVASGTATLELALLGVPMIVVYKVSPVTFLLGRLLVRVPSISLVNLVSRRAVVPELLQGDLKPEAIGALCCRLLESSIYYFDVKKGLAEVRDLLGRPGASERAAAVILEMLPDRARVEARGPHAARAAGPVCRPR
ncbi:MAG: lipid-A-disaccharide synthase [bacterium]